MLKDANDANNMHNSYTGRATIAKVINYLHAAARNIRSTSSVYFSQTSEDSSLPVLLPLTVCVVPEQ